MEERNWTLADVMNATLTSEHNEEEYADELIDACTILLVSINDERHNLCRLAYDKDAPKKVTSYTKNLIDILHDCAERIYELKCNIEMSR